MQLPTALAVTLLVSGGIALGRALPRQDAPAQEAAADPEMQAMLPGPVHEEMQRYAGEYEVLSRFFAGPDAEPVETRGTAKLSSVLGGRFLLEEDSGTMMGAPYEGLKLWGFNNGTQSFESLWVYSLSTGMLTMTGETKDEGESIDWNARYEDAGGEHEMRVVTTYPDVDTMVLKMNGPAPDGGEYTVLELTYRRKGEK